MNSSAKGKILIVDDEEGIRAVIKAILGSIDLETLEAPDGKTAVAMLRAERDSIAACMLDMNLEDSLGEDIYDELRSISPNLPVFAMSGVYGGEITERLGDREIAGLIPKPFSASKLIEALQESLKGLA